MSTYLKMKTKEILSHKTHRPWELPEMPWQYYQEWNKVVFLHWKISADILEKYIPKDLEIDLYNDKAWVSLVCFDMENIRPKSLPPFAPVSNFHEINLRTYVKKNDKQGVYFLNIEGSKSISCQIAKILSQLPYKHSTMHRSNGHFQSKSKQNNDNFDLSYSKSHSLKMKTPLDLWLTERYCLYQDYKKSMNTYDIHHIEWPINEIKVKSLFFNYSKFNELIQGQPNLMHYSPGVQVLAWSKKISAKNHITPLL